MAFKTITVPGHGEIDFPDSMSDDDIATAIRVNIIGAGAAESPAPAEKPSLLSRAVSAVKRVVSPEPKPALSDEEWAAQVASEADLKAAEKAGRKTPSYMEMGGTGLPIRPMKPTPDRPAAPVSAPAGTRYDIAGATSYPDRPRPEKTVSAPAGTRYDIAGARAVVKPEAFTPPTEEEYLEVKAKREAAWKKAWEKDNVAARRLGFKVGDEYPTAEAAIRAYRESVGEPLPEAPATFEDYVSERAAQYESERALKAQSEDLGREFEAEQRRRKKARSEADDKYAVKARARGMTTPEYMKSIGLEPYKEPYASPEAFAEERTGVPRGAGPVGRAMASAGDAWSDVAGATGWALVSRAITGKTKAERTGERIMQTEAALEEAKRVRAAKAKQAAGEELTEVERRTLESNRFFAQLGAAVEAVRENPGEAAEAILVDLIENAPVYALTNMGTVGAAKALTGAVKSTNNARRLANALAKGKSAAAAEIRAQRTAELGAKVIKPSALKTIGIEVATDVPADVAVGMVLEKARGRDYKAADLVTDLAFSGIINVPIGAVKSMKTGGILTPREFRQVADAFGDIGALATEPAVAEILGRLRTLSADEVLIPEGLKVSATGRAKAVSPEEARAAGYGEDVAAGPEAGRQILGSTDGADVKLRPGADLATLEEEIQTARFNVLRKRAAAGGAEESALLQRINDWAAAVHAENAARPEGQRVALPQQSEAGNLELFTKVLAGDETGIELVPLVDVPDDIFNEWGRIFNTRVRTGETEPRPGVMTGRPIEAAESAPEQPASAAPSPEQPAAEAPVAASAAPVAPAADVPTGPEAPKPSVEAFGEQGGVGRRPLGTEQPSPESMDFLAARAAEAQEGERLRSDARTASARLKRRPLPQYQLRGNRPLTPVTEQARQRAVDVARTVLASDKPMSAQTAAAKAGLKGKMAEEAAKRAIPIIKAVRQGKSYDEALAQDVLKRIMQKPSETIKQTILRTTEGKITGTEIVSAKAVLESLVRQSQLKADLEAAKTANREMRRIQRLIVAASKKALDPELQGQMLVAVRDARTSADLSAAMTRITTILSREQLKETVTRLEGLLKIDANKMEPKFRDAFKAIADDIDAGRGDAAARKYREWYEAQDDKPEIPKRFVKAMERIQGERLPSRGDIRSMEPERLAEEQAKWSSIADSLSTIAAAAEDARELRFGKDALKLELTVKRSLKEVAESNPYEIPSGKKPNIIKRAIRYGSSPEYLIMLAGGRDGILHNVLFKRPAAAMSQAYMAREEMRNIMKDFFASQGKSEQDLIRWRNEKFTVKTDAGKALTLTRPEAVSFYATLANDESRRLIEGNGIQKWEDRGTKRDYKLSDADIARIKSQMTDFDVRTAETMLAIFDHYKSKLNEASVLLEGYEKFTVENYFPRMASQDYLDKNLTNLREFWNAVMLEQDGFTKERDAHGKPLIIADAMNVFDRHIHDAAMYANMAVPLRNAARLIGNSDVSAEIAKRLGGGLEKQIQDFLFDASGMNGRAMMDDVSKFYRMMLRNLSVGILGYRPTTIINNLFGAAAQIYAEIPDKYRADFIKNWTTMTPAEDRAIFNEMKAMDAYFDHRYSRDPYRLATWGNTEMPETVASSEAYIQFKKMQDHAMKWMQNAERRAAVAAYKAIRDRTSRADAASELSKRFRDASDASDPVKEYAAHETMILTRRTQNAIDALDKSAFSRRMSESPLAMASFMFTSQLYKLRDMLFMATLDYRRGNISKAEYARKMALIMTSAAVIPTFASLAWREIKEGGKERKESDEQKRMGAGLMMLLNSAEIADPMAGSIIRAIADATRGGQGGGQRGQPIAQAVDKLTRNLTKALNKRDEESLDAFIAALGAGASIGGVPSAPFEALGAAVKFFRPDDPLIPYYNKKFKIEEKFGIHEPTGRKRTLAQALRAGVKLTPEEIREYKTASSIIDQGLKMRRLANEGHITDDQAEKIIEQRTKKP